MLGHLPVKHFLPLVCVNVGTAFSAMPARKITRLKINTCNTTVLRWLQLARSAFLICLPSLPLARVGSDKTQAWLGAGRRGERGDGKGMVVTGLSCATTLCAAFPPRVPHRKPSCPNPASHEGSCASLPWERQISCRNRMGELLLPLTAAADGLCLPTSPNSYLRCRFFFFLTSSPCKKRGILLKADVFPAQIQNFLIFGWGLLWF